MGPRMINTQVHAPSARLRSQPAGLRDAAPSGWWNIAHTMMWTMFHSLRKCVRGVNGEHNDAEQAYHIRGTGNGSHGLFVRRLFAWLPHRQIPLNRTQPWSPAMQRRPTWSPAMQRRTASCCYHHGMVRCRGFLLLSCRSGTGGWMGAGGAAGRRAGQVRAGMMVLP